MQKRGLIAMKEHKAILNKIHPDLLKPPHVIDALTNQVLDGWNPDSSQLKQLTTHLAECEYCRTASIILLTAESEYQQSNETANADFHKILGQFVKIHQELQFWSNEQLCAYAEAIVTVGNDEADKCYPLLAEHVSICSICGVNLQDILAFIQETGAIG